MKKVKNILAAAVIGSALLNPLKVYAYDITPSLAVVEESKNNINLKVEDTNSIVKSFQVSFKVDGAKVDSIKWNEKIEANGKANFKDNNGLITIYVTSKVNLIDDNGILNIGTLVVSGNDGDKFTITPSDMKLVTLNNKSVTASAVEYNGDSEFYTEGKGVDNNKPAPSPTPDGNNKPDGTDKPDGTEKPGETDKPGENEPADDDNSGENDDSKGETGSGNTSTGEDVNNTKPSEGTETNNKTEKKKSTSLKTGDYLKVGGLAVGLGVSAAALYVFRKDSYMPKH